MQSRRNMQGGGAARRVGVIACLTSVDSPCRAVLLFPVSEPKDCIEVVRSRLF
jgi:hypothetical protein